MGEMMILGRVLEPSKPADGLLGAWRFGSCIADEIVLLHHSDGTFRLTATVRTDHSETSHSVLLAPSPKVAESRWLVRAREHAPSLYEIMAAETARADALRGGGAVLTQREFLSIAARLPWMTLGELEARLRAMGER